MNNDEVHSSVETLSVLERLRKAGALTSAEFDVLTRSLVTAQRTQIRPPEPKAGGQRGSGFMAVLVLLVVLIIADHLQGPILPDDFYCMVGAGNSYVQPGRTEATSWSANNGCGAGRPECANRWTQYPASSHCAHGTLWEAFQNKLKGSGWLSPRASLF